MNPGELVRKVRNHHKLSQKQLAFRASTTQAAISKIENGQTSPSVETLERLLRVMGEQLTLGHTALERDYDPIHMAVVNRMTISERLTQSLEWNSFASELVGSAKKQ